MIHESEFRYWLPRWLAALFVFDIFTSCVDLYYNAFDFIGITGNLNWHASFLLATAPLVIYLILSKWTGNYIKDILLIGFALFIAVLSLAFINRCHTRGSWLALTVSAVLLGWSCLNRKFKLITLAVCFGGIFIFLLLLDCNIFSIPEYYLRNEARIFFTEAGLKLISTNPLLGVGVSRFPQEFRVFLPVEFYTSIFATDIVSHPHNHFIYIAATRGIIGLFTWLILVLIPLYNLLFNSKKYPMTPLDRVFLFSFLTLLFHGMFDKNLVSWPTNIIYLLLLGMMWKQYWPKREKITADQPSIPSGIISKLVTVSGIILLFGCFMLAMKTVGNTFPMQLMADGNYLKKNPAAAAYCYHNALGYQKNPTLIYYASAYMAEKLNNPDVAMKCFSMYKETPVPEGLGASNRLKALILCRQGKEKEALPYFQKQLEYYPLSIRDWYNLSMAYKRLRQPVKAAGAMEMMYKAMEIKKIDRRYLPYVLKNSLYDMQPHRMLSKYPTPPE